MEDFINGLPFEIDFRRMLQTSMESLEFGPNDGLKEMLRVAVANGATQVDVKAKPHQLTIEFDGSGVSTTQELTDLIYSLYSEHKDDKFHQTLEGFGKALIAILSQKPASVTLETGNEERSISMVVDSEFHPKILEHETPSAGNKVTVAYLNPPKPQEVYESFRQNGVRQGFLELGNFALLHFAKGVATAKDLIKSTMGDSETRKGLEELIPYSDAKITFNGRRFSRRGSIENGQLLSANYHVGDSHVLLSIPKGNSSAQKKLITYLKDYLVLRNYCQDESMVGVGTYDLLRRPNIVVNHPLLTRTITGEVHGDENYKRVREDIEIAIKLFYRDFLTQKLALPDLLTESDREDLYKFTGVLIRDVSLQEVEVNRLWDRLSEQDKYGNKDLWKEATDELGLFGLQIFKDTDGNEYTVSEMAQQLRTIPRSNHIFYTTDKKFDKSHKAYRILNLDQRLVLMFDNNIQRWLFEHIFSPIGTQFLETRSVTEIAAEKKMSILYAKNHYWCNLDDYRYRYEADALKRQVASLERGFKATGRATGKVLKYGGIPIGTGAAVIGTFYFGPSVFEHTVSYLLKHPEVLGGGLGVGAFGYSAYRFRRQLGAGARFVGEAVGVPVDYVSEKLDEIDERRAEKRNRKEQERKVRRAKKTIDRQASAAVNIGWHGITDEDTAGYVRAAVSHVAFAKLQRGLYPLSNIDKVTISPESSARMFDVKYSPVHSTRSVEWEFIISPNGKDSKKLVERYLATGGMSLFDDLLVIGGRILKQRIFSPDYTPLSTELIHLRYEQNLETIFGMLCDGNPQFKERFPLLGAPEKNYIARRALEFENPQLSDGRAELEEWLLAHHAPVLEQASRDIVAGSKLLELESIVSGHKLETPYETEIAFHQFLLLTPSQRMQFIERNFKDATLANSSESHFLPKVLRMYLASFEAGVAKRAYEYETRVIEDYESGDISRFLKVMKGIDPQEIPTGAHYIMGNTIFRNGSIEQDPEKIRMIVEVLPQNLTLKQLFEANRTYFENELERANPNHSEQNTFNLSKEGRPSVGVMVRCFYTLPRHFKIQFMERYRLERVFDPYYLSMLRMMSHALNPQGRIHPVDIYRPTPESQ